MRISDWSSDVCSSDLNREVEEIFDLHAVVPGFRVSIFAELGIIFEIPGRISVDNIVAIARTADEVESRRTVDRPDVMESVGPRYQRSATLQVSDDVANFIPPAMPGLSHLPTAGRSEERRVGKEFVSTCISRCSRQH